MSTSFLYIIGPQDGPVKIGFSKKPDQRVRQLQTANSEPLVLHHKVEFQENQIRPLERLIHKEMSYLRTKGEWFDMKPTEAMAQLDHLFILYEDVSPNIIRMKR